MQHEAVAASLADLSARIESLEQTTAWPICADHTARLTGLEKWEEKQNGHLVRIEDKMDGLKTTLLAAAGALIIALGGLVVELALLARNVPAKP